MRKNDLKSNPRWLPDIPKRLHARIPLTSHTPVYPHFETCTCCVAVACLFPLLGSIVLWTGANSSILVLRYTYMVARGLLQPVLAQCYWM